MGEARTQPGRIPKTTAARTEVPAGMGSVRLGTYLRKLREGYGYTLRKVEEQTVALGESIDNSQLSRFEKGKAAPSFEKLRALARVFNVPVQSFSDVLDLEEFEAQKPRSGNYAELLARGQDLLSRGQPGPAFVTFERALELAQEIATPASGAELVAEARWRMACALKALGKLYMTEHELRAILRDGSGLPAKTRLRSLLQLGYLYREFGDLYLATVLVNQCLELARSVGDVATEAAVLNSLGNIRTDEGRGAEAIAAYRGALERLDQAQCTEEMRATVMANLGGALALHGSFDDGLALLREAHARSLRGGLRRVAALTLTRMAEAWRARGDVKRSRELLQQSDALACRPEGGFHDLMFLNAYHRWKMAGEEGNRTGERIAFGRLRHLRALLQRRFPEVDEFDRHVERIRR